MSDVETTFPVEPWQLREVGLDPDHLARTESLFALSNGHIGVRGTLDEGEPNDLPGTYLNSFFESHRLTYPESGYGYPESGQSIVNVPNGKIIRLLVDDEPFDVRYGRLITHERTLDFRAGTLRREVEWETPAGQRVRVRSTRLVSLSQRAVLAIHYEVEPVATSARVVIQSELLANEPLPTPDGDAGTDDALPTRLIADGARVEGTRACLMHHTRLSELRMAAAVDHVLTADQEPGPELTSDEDWARLTVSTELAAGQRLGLTKFVAYGWSAERSDVALTDQVNAALTAAMDTGWDGLLAAQREYLDAFWARADVEVDGDREVQQAVRFGLFHLLQASARAEQRAIPAKGLTGTGYAGHAFWETETFVLPVLTATVPEAAADALRWRHATLPVAKEWARTLRLRGAAFAWRTIRGEECSSYWPAGTAAFHVNADIAVAAARQVHWTQDADFDRECALPLLVETARLWQCLGYVGADGHFHLDGVTGPDEYSALVNDNTFTNLAAAANLREAAAAARRWPDAAADLGVDAEEIAGWGQNADRMAVAYDDERDDAGAGPRIDVPAALGLRRVGREGRVPAAQPRDLLRPVPQAGGQTGRPGAGAAVVRRTVPPRREGGGVRVRRGADRTRLVPVGLQPGRAGGRGRPPRPGPRVPARGGAGRPAGPEGRYRGRSAHGLAGRHVDRPGLRLRRAAGPR